MENAGTCFVIQPFDGGTYDKRFEDVFAPAIAEAHLEPYRVDRDPRATVPIEQIEAGIRRAAICFANVTEDNPNVWFELGYAIASGRDVVLVCADHRASPFPFDIQHRTIIRYKTESTSDFARLREKIVERLKAMLERQLELGSITEVSPLKETEGLSPHEMVGLVTVAEGTDSPNDSIAASLARQNMRRAGFTDIAVTLAIRSLAKKGLVLTATDSDFNGNEFMVYRVTDRGIAWLESNQDRLVLRRQDAGPRPSTAFDPDDDLPF